MRWRGRRESENVEDRRGSSPRGGSLIGGGKGGIIGLLIILVGAYYGVDLSGLVGSTSGIGTQTQQQNYQPTEAEQELADFSKVILADTEEVWMNYFSRHFGEYYTPPKMVLYSGVTPTACGTGQSAMGPFYCPEDQRVYLDLSFYQDMQHKLHASGDAAFAYVIAHEVGHHIQNVLGILSKAHQAMQRTNKTAANQISVKIELQADCLAGIWGHYANKQGLMEEGDLEEAFAAAQAVGDDRLQKQQQGYIIPDSFTHGSAKQRLAWLQKGLNSGDINQCNTLVGR